MTAEIAAVAGVLFWCAIGLVTVIAIDRIIRSFTHD